MKFKVLLILIVGFCSCEKEIFIAQLPYDSKVSIQGIIEPDSIPIVYINRTVPYLTGSTKSGDIVVRKATVRISSVGESDLLKLDSVYDKVDCRYTYYYKGAIKTKRNTTYTLEITEGSKMYSATTTTNLRPVTIDSVSYIANFNDLYGEHEGIIAYFNDIPNETNYYRFEMLRSVDSTVRRGEKTLYGSCLAKDTIKYLELGRAVYNDLNLESQQIKIVIEPAFSHNKGIVGLVRMQTIDKATYEFYDQLDRQKLGQYNPFVEPYFLKPGQFGNDAVGFFGSKVRSKPFRFTYPE